MKTLTRFYVLLFILVFIIGFLLSCRIAGASEIKNITTINQDGLEDNECFINEAHFRTVKNGRCLNYYTVISDNGLMLETLDEEKKLIDSIEISGSQGTWSTGEYRDKRNYILEQLHWLRLNIIELERQLNYN